MNVLAAAARVRELADDDVLALDAASIAVVRRLVAWAGDRDTAAMLDWTARTCERYGNVRSLERLLRAAAPAAFADGTLCEELDLELDAVASIARRMGSAIDYAWPHAATHVGLDEIDALIDDFIVALDDVDAATAEHSRAVAAWCARIARHLGLSAEETTFARRAGLLHDVGKIRVPPAVLIAPRKLSSEEWVEMRAHATAGAELVAGVPALEAFCVPIRSHHERMDGSGYPDGIAAGSLPLTTRIVSVADGFNAMIAQRPYRRPLRPVDALDELDRHAGTQFDPEVVTALTTLIKQA